MSDATRLFVWLLALLLTFLLIGAGVLWFLGWLERDVIRPYSDPEAVAGWAVLPAEGDHPPGARFGDAVGGNPRFALTSPRVDPGRAREDSISEEGVFWKSRFEIAVYRQRYLIVYAAGDA